MSSPKGEGGGVCIGHVPAISEAPAANVLEMEGLIKALQRFRLYVYGQNLGVFTDNAATYSLANPDNLSDFVKRRLDAVLEFAPDIKFLPGKSNVIPDFLSRRGAMFSMGAAETPRSTQELLEYGHQGHLGPRKTMQRIRSVGGDVPWAVVKRHVQDCKSCQLFRHQSKLLPLVGLKKCTTFGRSLERISLDRWKTPKEDVNTSLQRSITCPVSHGHGLVAKPMRPRPFGVWKKSLGRWDRRQPCLPIPLPTSKGQKCVNGAELIMWTTFSRLRIAIRAMVCAKD